LYLNFFSKFLQVKNQVYQWNMKKIMVWIFLTMKATMLEIHGKINRDAYKGKVGWSQRFWSFWHISLHGLRNLPFMEKKMPISMSTQMEEFFLFKNIKKLLDGLKSYCYFNFFFQFFCIIFLVILTDMQVGSLKKRILKHR
jgi:hypothetical protein